MSSSAAGWAWKRPFVGSRSTSSPWASDTDTGKQNGTGQKAQLTKLNRLACCCCWKLFRPNASFRTLIVSYVSGTNQNQDGRWKKWSCSEDKVGFYFNMSFFCFEEKQSEQICSSRRCIREDKEWGFFSLCVPLLDTCKEDAFKARLF